jgi:hypothetical protein
MTNNIEKKEQDKRDRIIDLINKRKNREAISDALENKNKN